MRKSTVFKVKLIIICILSVVFLVFLSLIFKSNFPDAAMQYCDQVVVARVSELMNKTLIESKYIKSGSEVLDIQRDASGRITLIDVDAEKVNLIKSNLTLELLYALQNEEKMEFGIPLGNVLGSFLLSGTGPSVPIKVVPIGNVVSKTKSTFVSGGVNQTKYELYVEFIVCVEVLGPFVSETREINVNLCIAETIIVGESPGIIWGSNN